MYLKSLELQGFKSFPDKTKIEFDHGSTVIVGPNGSGKSNITDAMRWVLGEISSRSIRGAKMEDVVFAGADGRNPMGYAEVSISFENTDENGRIPVPYDEVTVTRRYYRAGDSEYFINRRPVRLRDINELFMNTGIGREGYSIVGQGKIAEIISQKSDERRGVFDEAAGISKFRHRRAEAERQLEAAEDNMQRVGDILTEVDGRRGPLEQEAEKARRYLELYERHRRADIALAVYDSDRLRTEQKRAEDDFLLSSHELEMISDTIDGLEAQSERIAESSQKSKLDSERAYERIRALSTSLQKLDGEYQAMKTDRTRSEAQAQEYRENAADASRRIAEAEKEAKSLEERLCESERALDAAQSALDAKKSELADADARLCAISDQLESMLAEQKKREEEVVDYKVRINVMIGSAKADEEKNASVESEIGKYEAQAAEFKSKADAESKTADEFSAAISESEKKIDALEEKLASCEERLAELTESRASSDARAQALSHRIDALVRLEENFEGYGRSVKYVMDGRDNIRGRVHGPVSRLISTPDEYVTAIETALGGNLQNIVVDDEETAKSAISYLKRGGAGRATFYPISAVRGQEPGREVRDAASAAGYVGICSELISYDAVYDGIMRYLLGRTCVFDDLDHATAAAKASGYKLRAVTLDGQQINAGGSFTGGSQRRDSGMLTRSGEIKSLRAELSLCERETAALTEQAKAVSSARADVHSELDGERSRRDMMDAMMRAAESARDAATAQYDAAVTLVGQLRADMELRAELSGQYESDRLDLTKKCAEAEAAVSEVRERRERLDISRHEAEDARTAASGSVSEAMMELTRISAGIDAVRELCAEKARGREEYVRQRDSFLARADEMTERAADIERREAENRRAYGDAESEMKNVEDERAKLETGNLEFEMRQGEIRRRIREKTDEKETAMRAHMKNEQRKNALSGDLDKLVAHLWDEYELTPSAAAEIDYPPVTEENRAETAREERECKNKLRALGPVNVGAIDEYREVSERYEYMKRQMDDLTAAKDELTGIIAELNADMEKNFRDAFGRISERFGQVFRELFGGGEAELYLDDPDDVLSSGIGIKAAPPGKVIKNLSLLSGGEQAFVAIALLFAMIHVNPTPFCIFDEIESALDEVNVERFAAYIKRYSDKMQFVIITHRRGTMETADSLYGITMPRHGISRVLTLDPGDMEAKDKYASEPQTDAD